MKFVHIIISGDVQGVGFRSWVKKEANQLKLTGWVKNRQDGSVEIAAEGTKLNLENFITLCRKGTELAWVEDVKVNWGIASGEFEVFQVVY